MAQHVKINDVYSDKVTVASIVSRTWSRIFLGDESAHFEVKNTPTGLTSVSTVRFPMEEDDEAYTGAALTDGSYKAVGVEIAISQKNSVAVSLSALATLETANPYDVEVIGTLAETFLYNQNNQVRDLVVTGASAIPFTSGEVYTHVCNNSGAGSSVNPIATGLCHLGAASASLTECSGVLAGAVLSPSIVRGAVETLRARGAKPWTFVEGMPLFGCIAQSEQMQFLKAHADFKDTANLVIGAAQGLYGSSYLIYQGVLFISVSDARVASTVGPGRADTAHLVQFFGADFILKPFLNPVALPGGTGSEIMDLYGEAQVRLGATGVDAPINAARKAATYYANGMGILNPKHGLKYILHPNAS